MQTPTPPTKPIPPTPPAMNPKSSENNANPPSSNSVNIDKSAAAKIPTEGKTNIPPPASTKQTASPSSIDNNSAPAQPSSGTYQETSSQATPASTVSTAKNNSSPLGFGFFFSLVILIAISLACFRLWKSNQNKRRTILNYSADSQQDLLNLMNSSAAPSSSPSPQKIAQKKNKSSSKIKGNFEVRV